MNDRSAFAGKRIWGVRGFVGLAVGMCVAGTGCRERNRPDPSVRMAISHERAIQSPGSPSGGAGPGGDVPTQLVIPPDVAHAYTGIRLAWKDRSDGKEGVLEVPLGSKSPVPGSSLAVQADAFLPAFTMGGGAITSEGVEPTNPAARIAVFEKGQQIFGGWIFTKFPDVHPFTHQRYELRLEGGVGKAGT